MHTRQTFLRVMLSFISHMEFFTVPQCPQAEWTLEDTLCQQHHHREAFLGETYRGMKGSQTPGRKRSRPFHPTNLSGGSSSCHLTIMGFCKVMTTSKVKQPKRSWFQEASMSPEQMSASQSHSLTLRPQSMSVLLDDLRDPFKNTC